MRIKSIEPTPSPNSMKLNMDESLPKGVTYNVSLDNRSEAANVPEYIDQLLGISGIKGIFQVNDFIAIERSPKTDWRDILANVETIFDKQDTNITAKQDEVEESEEEQTRPEENFGEVIVFYQIFRGIPMQAKLMVGTEEIRVGLPERFVNAIMRAQSSASNLVLERKWEEQGPRYGDPQDIEKDIIEELSAAYDEERLNRLVDQAFQQNQPEENKDPVEELTVEEIMEELEDPNWKKRYAALEQMKLTKDSLPALMKALKDPKTSNRRLATAYLGEIGESEVLPALFKALKDKSAAVRRTAGDALSDVGDPAAIEPMKEALQDSNKLVRWRAARFLYEVGDESAITALEEAQDDPEFEVSMQVKIALERIKGGETAEGSVWQQMAKARSNKE